MTKITVWQAIDRLPGEHGAYSEEAIYKQFGRK